MYSFFDFNFGDAAIAHLLPHYTPEKCRRYHHVALNLAALRTKMWLLFSNSPQMFASVPILPQELHQSLFFIQHAEERDTLLALSFV